MSDENSPNPSEATGNTQPFPKAAANVNANSSHPLASPGDLPTEAIERARSLLDAPPESIGPYRIIERLGSGGMGEVYRADQKTPIRRQVAIKLIKLGMDTKQVIARFEAERQALALMDHPNIAKVFEANTDQSGRPYFVMEYVKGIPIHQYADRNHLNIPERVELFQQVCYAIQHAHHKGIIHRDIKPSNVLTSTQDGKPHAKIIDFGIAKAVSQQLTDNSIYTLHDQFIGTPQYMSPEQAEGSLDIDTRTDVYSLGVLLYELLTGTTPFSLKEIRAVALEQVKKVICEVEPPKPSTRLTLSEPTLESLAAARRTEPKRLNSLVRGELDWIVMMALDKDRRRRYDSPNSLAEDLAAFLSGGAVQAAPPSRWYRLQKFARKNKGPVLVGSALTASLVAGLAATTWQWRRADKNAQLALDHAAQAMQSEKTAITEREIAIQQREAAEMESYIANLNLAQTAMQNNDYPEARRLLALCPQANRGWEWDYLNEVAGLVMHRIPINCSDDISLAHQKLFYSDDTHFSIAELKGQAKAQHFRLPNSDVAFNGYGTSIAHHDGTQRVWIAQRDQITSWDYDGNLRWVRNIPGVDEMVLSSDGKYIASKANSKFQLILAASGEITLEEELASSVECLAFSQDSKTVALSTDKFVRYLPIGGTAKDALTCRFPAQSNNHDRYINRDDLQFLSPNLLVVKGNWLTEYANSQGIPLLFLDNREKCVRIDEDSETIAVFTDSNRGELVFVGTDGSFHREQATRFVGHSPSHKLLLLEEGNNRFSLWNTQSRSIIRSFEHLKNIELDEVSGHLAIQLKDTCLVRIFRLESLELRELACFGLKNDYWKFVSNRFHTVDSVFDNTGRCIARGNDKFYLTTYEGDRYAKSFSYTGLGGTYIFDANRIDSPQYDEPAIVAATAYDGRFDQEAVLEDAVHPRIIRADGRSLQIMDRHTHRTLTTILSIEGQQVAATADNKKLIVKNARRGNCTILDSRTYEERQKERDAIFEARFEAQKLVDAAWESTEPLSSIEKSVRSNTQLTWPIRAAAGKALYDKTLILEHEARKIFEALKLDLLEKQPITAEATAKYADTRLWRDQGPLWKLVLSYKGPNAEDYNTAARNLILIQHSDEKYRQALDLAKKAASQNYDYIDTLLVALWRNEEYAELLDEYNKLVAKQKAGEADLFASSLLCAAIASVHTGQFEQAKSLYDQAAVLKQTMERDDDWDEFHQLLWDDATKLFNGKP